MDIFGFSGLKKSVKNIDVVPEIIQEHDVFKDDPERYDRESDMNRGEHYNRQRRRSRYFNV